MHWCFFVSMNTIKDPRCGCRSRCCLKAVESSSFPHFWQCPARNEDEPRYTAIFFGSIEVPAPTARYKSRVHGTTTVAECRTTWEGTDEKTQRQLQHHLRWTLCQMLLCSLLCCGNLAAHTVHDSHPSTTWGRRLSRNSRSA